MSKKLIQKKFSLFLLLASSYYSSVQTNPIKFLFTLLFSNPSVQPKREPQKTLPGVTITNFFNQVRHDLQPLAPHLINDIIQKTHTAITLEEKKNLDLALVNQKLKSTIIYIVYDQAHAIAMQAGNTDPLVASKIAQSEANNVRVELEKHSHPNGQALYTFFGDDLKHRIISSMRNPAYANYYGHYAQSNNNTAPSYNTQQPPAPTAPSVSIAPPAPVPAAPQIDRDAIIEEGKKTIKMKLSSVLSPEDLHNLQQLYVKHVRQQTELHPEDFSHIKGSLLQLREKSIAFYGKEIISELGDKAKLNDALGQIRSNILKVRLEGATQIKSMKRIDKEAIESLFGKNLKTKLSENIAT